MQVIKSLTVFYDSYCPLCMIEMRHLSQRNREGKITFVDINDASFNANFPELAFEQLSARIHGITSTGELITGLDVTYHAWRLVGVGWLYAPLRWPVIRPFADWVYVKFAKHRHRISYWITRKERCKSCAEKL